MEIVPFEIAKKLKEKGFNAEFKYSIGYYDTLGNFMSAADHWFLDSWIVAPAISQVLKWLRDKGIYLPFYYDCKYKIWVYGVLKMEDGEFELRDEKTYESYELAAIAGIEYCLDNLI